MSFDKVDTQIDFPAQERAILAFWERAGAFERLRAQNRDRPGWSFLDGPITANNPMGVHHAWGRTYKDAYQRYHAMTGHALRYQNGFDCQGLWVEVEVEKELGLRSKREIEELVPGDRFASIDRFVRLCKERVDRFARIQTDQSIRLGYWMDWDRDDDWRKPPDKRRSYYTMSEENNYTIWSFLKKCHERELVYRGYDAMPWCPRCGVGLSQMEMHEGYRLVAHRAVFVRLPLRDRPSESLLVWTTTPWTLSSNVAAAVNPQLTYLRVRHRAGVDYVARGAFTAHRLEEEFRRKEWVDGVPKLKTLEQLYKEKGGYELAGELSGSDMVGWAYDGPFDELAAQAHSGGYPAEVASVVRGQGWAPDRPAREIHRVIGWDQVGEREGTGIVHIAPGCGKEDFQLGKAEGLVPIAPLDEEGMYLAGFGALSGRPAVGEETVEWTIADLQRKGLLLAVERYPHSYPHCWRCKTELLFRLVDEWFISMKWRGEIMSVTEDVTFLPEMINGRARELDWLRNMGDWMISKKRFWGLALPLWVCASCDAFEVMGGRDELKAKAVAGWERFEGHAPHRPWIDLVRTRCPKCGGEATRVPDVGNPWLDAGIVPYSTLGYSRDRAYWEKWFPADFITECFPGQFRNWFYAMLAMSTMMTERAPFKVLLGHALVRDEKGEEMHKSKGNAIPFEEAAEKMSADLMRWMFCRNPAAQNINFGYKQAEEVRGRFLLKLWNTYAFFCNYARLDGFDPTEALVPVERRPDLDRWILSDLQLLVQAARHEFERYNVMGFCLLAEQFVDDRLSNWYVRRNRRRFWKSERGEDKLAAYQTLYTILTTLTKLLAPIVPFLSESMYQNLMAGIPEAKESVHLESYPEAITQLVDADLSADMEALLRLVSLGSAARNSVKIKVRQPLAELRVQPGEDRERRAVERFAGQILEELNVKCVTLHDAGNGALLHYEVKPNPKTLGPRLGPRLKEVQAALAALDPAEVARGILAGGTIELGGSDAPLTLEPADVALLTRAPDGWAGVADGQTQVLLDVRMTPELIREGMAREVVRHVQSLRKDAGLELEDRIELWLESESEELCRAVVEYQSFIAAETLTAVWAKGPLDEVPASHVKLEGQALLVQLRRTERGA